MKNVLFILKRREDYSSHQNTSNGMSTGLFNSVKFIADCFPEACEMVVVTDNNDIDREVTRHKPAVVIIEGLWVIPEKFEILEKLHPNVQWIIRTHSKTQFIAAEGIAMEWILKYLKYKNVSVASNTIDFYEELKILTGTKFIDMIGEKYSDNEKIYYLPNIYPQVTRTKHNNMMKNSHFINIGCFGAIRPLKNHLLQAMAAIEFAECIGKKLNFHVNSNRLEMRGESVLRNLIGLFFMMKDRGHELVVHTWMPHDEFIDVIKNEIDIGMQISLSETFNIVAADMVAAGKPIVTSKEVPWSYTTAATGCMESMVGALISAYYFPKINLWLNETTLNLYCKRSTKVWKQFLI